MKNLFKILLCLSFIVSSCDTYPSYRDTNIKLKPVSAIEISRYTGTWYEIARLPNRFEKNCINVTAEYQAIKDYVKVKNTCFKKDSLKKQVANGKAKPIIGTNNSVFFVNFAPIPLPQGEGNYYILYNDDYKHALVGTPSGKYLWILSRDRKIDQTKLDEILNIAKSNGYDVSKLEFNIQQ